MSLRRLVLSIILPFHRIIGLIIKAYGEIRQEMYILRFIMLSCIRYVPFCRRADLASGARDASTLYVCS